MLYFLIVTEINYTNLKLIFGYKKQDIKYVMQNNLLKNLCDDENNEYFYKNDIFDKRDL